MSGAEIGAGRRLRGAGTVVPIPRPRTTGAAFGSPLPPPRAPRRQPPTVVTPLTPLITPEPIDSRVRVKTVSRKRLSLGDLNDTPRYRVSPAARSDVMAVVDEDAAESRGLAIGRMLAGAAGPSMPLTPLARVEDDPPEDEVTDKVTRGA